MPRTSKNSKEKSVSLYIVAYSREELDGEDLFDITILFQSILDNIPISQCTQLAALFLATGRAQLIQGSTSDKEKQIEEVSHLIDDAGFAWEIR